METIAMPYHLKNNNMKTCARQHSNPSLICHLPQAEFMPMEAGYSRSVPKSAGREGARENHPHESTHESQLFGKNEGMSLVILR